MTFTRAVRRLAPVVLLLAALSHAATAHQPPSVLRGDELAQTTFWHGKLLRERARRWVDYQTRRSSHLRPYRHGRRRYRHRP